jgi:hypothetical protein
MVSLKWVSYKSTGPRTEVFVFITVRTVPPECESIPDLLARSIVAIKMAMC